MRTHVRVSVCVSACVCERKMHVRVYVWREYINKAYKCVHTCPFRYVSVHQVTVQPQP